ncbi:alpha/beta hydrolase [Chryseotalea sanaruensis]|uniref:Alpha/beta hydrolase n=1 Tax=Chryseotalea sanaruensis TaxID=2482724 RepID=A0A401UCE1_9BACT|nr:alpha/beta fold hydrolase [Chryseotalea sanaruensis]GCC52557.1 alpha/beta hydrolase [Chryseotalea sanaruensis]
MSYPVLLLHGALGAASQFETLQQMLEAQGRKVYGLNFSGHGGKVASQKGFSISVFADEVFDFLEENALSQVNIFGYSMGGYVALWLAHHHPEKINKIFTLGTKFDWSEESATLETKKLNPDKILEKVPAFAKVLEERHKPLDWKEVMWNTANLMRELGREPLLNEEALCSIDTRTCVAVGDSDDMVNRFHSEEVPKLLTNASFMIMKETPHMIERVNLTLLGQALNEFFA